MTCAGLASSLRSRMPVTPVQLRIRGEPAVLMRMPEASVDEDRNFSPLVREIRFPGKIAHIHPRPDARSREQRPNHRSHAVGARGRVERGRSGDAGAG